MISTYISWLKMYNAHEVQAAKTIKKFNPWINKTYYLFNEIIYSFMSSICCQC